MLSYQQEAEVPQKRLHYKGRAAKDWKFPDKCREEEGGASASQGCPEMSLLNGEPGYRQARANTWRKNLLTYCLLFTVT